MSTHVIGFAEPDEEFKKKIAAYRALEAAGEEIPDSLNEYFNWEEPDEAGLEVELETTEWSDNNYRDGYELDLSKVPKHVKKLRFYNSW